ncbi:unnamed protein product [Urochloa humidicola]
MAALTDEILEEIFLRIASPADLARASSACLSFRRLIAGPAFLRRYRSLHPPLLLGFLYPGSGGFQPAEAPHPNAPAAGALARGAGFYFDYIPRGRGRQWYPRDVRDGRILLFCSPDAPDGIVFPDLAVCDPVSRRYLLLPQVPDELLTSVQVQKQHVHFLEAFLVPSGVEQEEEETLFKVLGRVCCVSKMVVLVFSSGSGHWDVGISESWDALSLSGRPFVEGLMLSSPSYAYGCFYWQIKSKNKLLKLDINRMKVSAIDFLPGYAVMNVVIVETGEGRLGMFSNSNHVHGDAPVYYATRKNEGDSSNGWQMEKTIPLPVDYNCCLVGAPEGYIFLLGVPKNHGTLGPACFSLDIKTLKIERVSQMRLRYCHVYPYFGFPPFMLPRTV